ncbi:MAG: START domain-containing protein [Cocleimonas sp.]|nr:START domain-containing protein [Cocleimonas sp.]
MRIKITQWVLMIAIFSVGIVEAKSSWELSKQADGIQIYTRDTPNSKLKSFRADVIIPTRLTSLVAVLEDTTVFPRLFHNCKSAKSLKKVGHNEFYNYIVTGMPWPVNSRDLIAHSIISQDRKTKRIDIIINSKSNMVPQKSGIVRVKHLVGRWEFMPLKNGTTKVTYELNLEPSGNIPAWLVNLLIVDTPFYTLLNLRKLVKEPIYMNAKRRYIID